MAADGRRCRKARKVAREININVGQAELWPDGGRETEGGELVATIWWPQGPSAHRDKVPMSGAPGIVDGIKTAGAIDGSISICMGDGRRTSRRREGEILARVREAIRQGTAAPCSASTARQTVTLKIVGGALPKRRCLSHYPAQRHGRHGRAAAKHLALCCARRQRFAKAFGQLHSDSDQRAMMTNDQPTQGHLPKACGVASDRGCRRYRSARLSAGLDFPRCVRPYSPMARSKPTPTRRRDKHRRR